ncbi:AAA family ATPase [Thalassorhabdomicrobium marinisediminis]|uniref:AAA family ATPase n=1 Tax=Thalassorhabdomicrobium marinisediminis TaxID=2170577 RepID=UPI002491A7F6|nr:AAA family ATPase [Thalassorhabdomicrobium marinisediminis]
MKEDEFRVWLESKGMDRGGVSSRLSSVKRVEQVLDGLDDLAMNQTREAFLKPFTYTSEDKRLGKPNPSPLSFSEGADLYNGLSSIRTALGHFHDFVHQSGPDDSKEIQGALIAKLTRQEIEMAMNDCSRLGLGGFLAKGGFKKPVVWVLRDAERYPAKATVVAAIGHLQDGPELTAKTFFKGFGEQQAFDCLERLGYELDRDGKIGRARIEDAMDAYDQYRATGAHSEIFDAFGDPRDYWVRSTRDRENRVYPTKPLIGFILNKTKLNGGWGEPSDAAARLHNAGFIIVDQNDQPTERPERYEHLMEGADRIILCALNYFIEPAKEKGDTEVSIRAGFFGKYLGLKDRHPSICGALGNERLQALAQIPPPTSTEPNPSSSTVFTYTLNSQPEADTLTDTKKAPLPSAVNLILYGPPGTGKTYQTAWEAVRLCLGDEATAALNGQDGRAELMSTYRSLVSEGRIEFVTFHQSMSYEEFIEGLRPTTDQSEDSSAGTGFRLEPVPGIFRRISERAEKGVPTVPQENVFSIDGRQVFKMSIARANVAAEDYLFEEAISEGHTLLGWEDIDFSDDRFSDVEEILEACRTQGEREGEATLQSGQVSQVDVFRNQLDVGDIIVVTKGNSLFRAIGEVTGEYEYRQRDNRKYCHRRSVRWLWVDREGVPASEIYDSNFTMKSIYALDRARLDTVALESYMNSGGEPVHREARPHVLIIDEINRANISKVFGELITLLEADKRLGMANEIRLTLPYSKKSFGVPQNLHIIGTMNTADRSIALLDTALRRRFSFKELMPDPSVLSDNVEGVDLQKLLYTINERIEYLFDREHQIGHAYFTGCQTRSDIESVMRDKVIPLLAEYFYEDWSKVAAVLGDSAQGPARFLDAKRITAPAGMTEDDFSGEKLRWTVKDSFDFTEFAA